MNRTTTMTAGNPAKLIINFAFPLILANLGQQFYTIVDAMIVGQGVGVEALAAVGATDWAYWLALWFIGAMTQGFAVPISQYFGEGNQKQLKRSVTASIRLCLGIGIFLTVFCLAIGRPLLLLLQTPENIFDSALSYLITMYCGILIVMAYNMAASILRGLGDSKTPLVAILIAGFTNITLDALFVLAFHWGILGAAFATLISQLLAFLYCFRVLIKMELMHMNREDWQIDRNIVRNQCGLGLPPAFQHVLIVIGGMILQFAINQQGFAFIAGFTATNKIYGVLESSAISIGHAISTYSAQNYGAGLYSRIRKGLKSALTIGLSISTAISVVMILFGKHVVSLFIDKANESSGEVLDVAYNYLFVMCLALFILYLLHIFRCTLMGLGNASAPFWSGVMEFFARVSIAIFFTKWFGTGALYFAEPGAWLASILVLIPVCLKMIRKLPLEKVTE